MINYSVSPQVNPQNPEAAPKFYAKAQFVNNLDINAFARHIAMHGTVYSRADVAAILTLAVDCIREQMLEGNKVSLGELGSFSVSLQSNGAKTAEEFVPGKIYGVKVNWTPGSEFKDLIEDAKFTKVPSRIAQRAILAAETKGNQTVDLQAIKDAEREKRA